MAERSSLNRRGFVFAGAVLGAGTLAACTSNEPKNDASSQQQNVSTGGDNDKAGKQITIGFSAPAADHGWIAAIAKNAQAQAKNYSDVTFKPVQPTNDINQRSACSCCCRTTGSSSTRSPVRPPTPGSLW